MRFLFALLIAAPLPAQQAIPLPIPDQIIRVEAPAPIKIYQCVFIDGLVNAGLSFGRIIKYWYVKLQTENEQRYILRITNCHSDDI